MSAAGEQRKLAVIMLTDTTAYRALAQRDDQLAPEWLKEHRRLDSQSTLSEMAREVHGRSNVKIDICSPKLKRRNCSSRPASNPEHRGEKH